MTHAADWRREATDGKARAGVLSLTHGEVPTPAFMPVGTRATVRALDVHDLAAAGVEIVLCNTYHLMLRPGAELIAELGGLHSFMAWPGPILTDSGGYQIFSLDPRVSEEGADFRSTYDGSPVHLTPEGAVRIQELLGSDIAMCLDVLVGLPSEPPVVETAMERTLRWEERALTVHRRRDQALFGIIQGGVDPALRQKSAVATADLGFAGFGVGGLSVGETSSERNLALECVMGYLPDDKVRYVMGLGDAEGVLDAIARGADIFDCVWPTRLARHGKVLSPDGDFNLRRAAFSTDARPLHHECLCLTCTTYSRAYLRHLLATAELAVYRLITVHNLTYTLGLMAAARRAIVDGSYASFQGAVIERRRAGAW
jgi:queuine tRNA-ribosyltransferase